MKFETPELLAYPYDLYADWRDNHPIWQDEQTGMWVLSRHDDVRGVLKNSQDYSSKAMGDRSTPLPLLTDDPPRHTQLRGPCPQRIFHMNPQQQ